MLTSWLQRSAGFDAGAKVSDADLLKAAIRVRRAGVVVDAFAWLALSEPERNALAYVDVAAALAEDDETWADKARAEFAEGLKRGQ